MKKRTRLQLSIEILVILEEGPRSSYNRNYLMYGLQTNYNIVTELLARLKAYKLIEETDGLYNIEDKGLLAIRRYEALMELWKI